MFAGTMAASLTACGGGAADATTAAPAQNNAAAEKTEETKAADAASGEKTVITVWTMDRHDSECVDAKIEEFNATNDKGIEIVQNVITDDYANMLALAYSSGTVPDIAGVGAATSDFDLKTFAEAGIIDTLNDYITDPEFEKVTEAGTLQFEGINMLNGNVYWIPTGMRTKMHKSYSDKKKVKKMRIMLEIAN